MIAWCWDAPRLARLLPQLACVLADRAASAVQAPPVILTQQPGAALRVVPATACTSFQAVQADDDVLLRSAD